MSPGNSALSPFRVAQLPMVSETSSYEVFRRRVHQAILKGDASDSIGIDHLNKRLDGFQVEFFHEGTMYLNSYPAGGQSLRGAGEFNDRSGTSGQDP